MNLLCDDCNRLTSGHCWQHPFWFNYYPIQFTTGGNIELPQKVKVKISRETLENTNHIWADCDAPPDYIVVEGELTDEPLSGFVMFGAYEK